MPESSKNNIETAIDWVRSSARRLLHKFIFDPREFIKQIRKWESDGKINEESGKKILDSLRSSDVRKHIFLYGELNAFAIIFDNTLVKPIGLAAGIQYGTDIGLLAFGVATAVESVLLKIYVEKRGTDLKDKSLMGSLSMTPKIGPHTPPIFLSKNHPEFLQFFYAYQKTKWVSRLIDEEKDLDPYLMEMLVASREISFLASMKFLEEIERLKSHSVSRIFRALHRFITTDTESRQNHEAP
jgi:hypothetical protein